MATPSFHTHSTWTWDAPAFAEPPQPSTFERLWLGFMVGRIGIAVSLLVLAAAASTRSGCPPWASTCWRSRR
jgi:hypothetical protein